MLVRRECLQEIGIFDQRYFAYGDEHELGARAVREGWKVVMVWGAVVVNPVTSTENAWRSYLFARNSLFLVHDYFGGAAATLRAGCNASETIPTCSSNRSHLRKRKRTFESCTTTTGTIKRCIGRHKQVPGTLRR